MTDVRQAVLIPGRGYTVREPLFAYVAELLRRRRLHAHGIEWEVPQDLAEAERGPWVQRQAAAAIDERTALLVGKSLGTLAAPVATERRLPAVWLTPLLRYPGLAEAFERSEAPFLLVGGTADPSWDAATARRLTPHVLEIPHGDHGLLVPGPMARSADALGQVCTAIEQFLEDRAISRI
ncbi:alpha/beta hydrolase [Micromonospora sp. NPDC049679]|uniref:alpha/beta hydrolase n=1 Tax=Micromonospora sp. NPDC049679 TaxID=3155920 RepID=UPI0033F5D30D